MVRMNIADGHQPIVLLNDGETFTGLGGCELIVLTHEEAERVADDNWEPNKLAGEMLFGFFGSGSNDFVLAGGPQARQCGFNFASVKYRIGDDVQSLLSRKPRQTVRLRGRPRMWSLITDEDAAYLKAHDNWNPSITAKVEQATKECENLLGR
jgi:hypothetical protein